MRPGSFDGPRGVFNRERRQQIRETVDATGRVRVIELADRFGVSPVTIRKDLLALAREQRLVRTHGGAIGYATIRPEAGFDIRDLLQREEKLAIGAAAAALVGDNESIALDASTTAMYIARSLRNRSTLQGLTVVTNGLRSALELVGHPGITVVMLGGRVRWEALSVVGPLGDAVFRRVNIQKTFMGCAGLTIQTGVTDVMEEEAHIKRLMAAAAREVYCVADHTKWGKIASATSCRTARLTGAFTDQQAPAEIVHAFRERGIEVRQVGREDAARGVVKSPR